MNALQAAAKRLRIATAKLDAAKRSGKGVEAALAAKIQAEKHWEKVKGQRGGTT